MEARQQTGQEENLVRVRMAMGGLESRNAPLNGRGCFWCKVFAAAAVIFVLVFFICLHSLFKTSCTKVSAHNKAVSPQDHSPKIFKVSKLNKGNEKGTYDIFTADKAADYLIYGWVKIPNPTSENFILMQVNGESRRTIQQKSTNETKIFFFNDAKLVKNVTITLQFRGRYTDSLFRFYEL